MINNDILTNSSSSYASIRTSPLPRERLGLEPGGFRQARGQETWLADPSGRDRKGRRSDQGARIFRAYLATNLVSNPWVASGSRKRLSCRRRLPGDFATPSVFSSARPTPREPATQCEPFICFCWFFAKTMATPVPNLIFSLFFVSPCSPLPTLLCFGLFLFFFFFFLLFR